MMPMIMVRAAARVAARASAPTDLRSDMEADHVEIDAQHNRHAGFFLTREFTLRHPLFRGGLSAPVRREVFVATDAAIVLPYDPVRDRVLLVEQFRMGPFGRGDPFPWMLEPVAGRVDPGEPPEETARRECVEEAGLTLDTVGACIKPLLLAGMFDGVFSIAMWALRSWTPGAPARVALRARMRISAPM